MSTIAFDSLITAEGDIVTWIEVTTVCVKEAPSLGGVPGSVETVTTHLEIVRWVSPDGSWCESRSTRVTHHVEVVRNATRITCVVRDEVSIAETSDRGIGKRLLLSDFAYWS